MKSFDTQNANVSEPSKVKYAFSHWSGEELQWWELLNINHEINIQSFQDFSKKTLEYSAMNALKQMGQYSNIKDSSQKLTVFEQIFHYTQGLKIIIIIGVDRDKIDSLRTAMKLTERMDLKLGGK